MNLDKALLSVTWRTLGPMITISAPAIWAMEAGHISKAAASIIIVCSLIPVVILIKLLYNKL